MPKTPYTRLTTAGLNALLSTQLGSITTAQIRQIVELLDRLHYNIGGMSDISNEPTLTQIVAKLGSNNP